MRPRKRAKALEILADASSFFFSRALFYFCSVVTAEAAEAQDTGLPPEGEEATEEVAEVSFALPLSCRVVLSLSLGSACRVALYSFVIFISLIFFFSFSLTLIAVLLLFLSSKSKQFRLWRRRLRRR